MIRTRTPIPVSSRTFRFQFRRNVWSCAPVYGKITVNQHDLWALHALHFQFTGLQPEKRRANQAAHFTDNPAHLRPLPTFSFAPKPMDVSVRSLWIGDVQPSYTEDMLYPMFASASACVSRCGRGHRCFLSFLLASTFATLCSSGVFVVFFWPGGPGELISVKFMRDKITGLPVGYGFAEFISQEAASRALAALNGRPIGGLCGGILPVSRGRSVGARECVESLVDFTASYRGDAASA
jgi:hypothetical protein